MAIIADKLTPRAELLECFALLKVVVLNVNHKIKLVEQGILPHLLQNCSLTSSTPDTVIATLDLLCLLIKSSQARSELWIAAGVHKRLLELLHATPEITRLVLRVFWNLSDLEVYSPFLSDTTLVAHFISVFNNGLRTPTLLADKYSHPKLAMECLCNLAAWETARPTLIMMGVVDALTPLLKNEGYLGVRSLMGLACLVGSREDKESKLLVAQPAVIEKLIDILKAAIQKKDIFDGSFSVEEVSLSFVLCVFELMLMCRRSV